MKKIKLFALAVMAMLGTNAFAAHTLTSGNSQTIGNIEYTVLTVYKTPSATKVNTVSAKANNFTGSALKIPATVTFSVEGTDDEPTPVAISQECTFNVVEIEENAFLNNTNITSVSIPATVTEIGAFAFEGCENLTTFTLAANSNLITIGDGAFAYTSLTKLDLTNATANTKGTTATTDDGMQEFGWSTALTVAEQTGSPFVSKKTSHTANLMIKEVILPTVCKTINASAFKDSKNLNTIDLKKIGDIKANAFENCAKLTSVQIGTGITFAAAAANGVKIAAEAFKGCSALATVELGTLIAAADIADEAFDKTNGSCAKLATFTFNEIRGAISANAFNLATVRTLNFKNYIKVASLIPDAAFQAAFPAPTETELNTINYIYTDRGDNALVNGFASTAFAASTTTNTITMNTTSEFEGKGYTINKVNIVGGYSSDIVIGNATTKKLVKDKNSSNYYYFVTIPADGKKVILKEQVDENGDKTGANVTVYQAYMDVVGNVANAYFMPLRVKDGKYVIGNATAAQTYIVKSNKEDGVVASVGAAADAYTTIFDATPAPINELQNTGDNTYSLLKVQTDATLMNGGANDIWFFNNPASSGFGFTKYDASKQNGLGANTVYFQTAVSAAAPRLNIIWLDEEGNTTAIQKVELENTSINNDAIYNVAGQKVSASYKGLVIKGGKKYIQK